MTDLVARLRALLPLLEDGRQTHVEWRDWFRKYPEELAKHPGIGDAEFHDSMVAEYDERIAVVTEAAAALAAS